MSWQETTEIWDSEMLLVPGVPMQLTFLYIYQWHFDAIILNYYSAGCCVEGQSSAVPVKSGSCVFSVTVKIQSPMLTLDLRKGRTVSFIWNI